MFTSDQYSLLDFGDTRRLERFGPLVLDRPCPAVEKMPCADRTSWAEADARFGDRGSEDEQWSEKDGLPDPTRVYGNGLRWLSRYTCECVSVPGVARENGSWRDQLRALILIALARASIFSASASRLVFLSNKARFSRLIPTVG